MKVPFLLPEIKGLGVMAVMTTSGTMLACKIW